MSIDIAWQAVDPCSEVYVKLYLETVLKICDRDEPPSCMCHGWRKCCSNQLVNAGSHAGRPYVPWRSP